MNRVSKRLLGVHRQYGDEVFLRVLGILDGAHGGGLKGVPGWENLTTDAILPLWAVGIFGAPPMPSREYVDGVLGVLKAETAELREEALDRLRDSGQSDAAFRLSMLPRESRYLPMLPWLAKIVHEDIKRVNCSPGEAIRLYVGSDKDPDYSGHQQQVDAGNFLLSVSRPTVSRLSMVPLDRLASDPPRYFDTGDRLKMANLAQYADRLPGITDWVEATRPDLLSLDYDTILDAVTMWHDELYRQSREGAAREASGEILYSSDAGVTLQRLETHSQLEAEGSAMGHCVGSGGYYELISRGALDVLSLRDAKGDPHATLEVQNIAQWQAQDRMTYRLTQVKGRGNQPLHPRWIPDLRDAIHHVYGGKHLSFDTVESTLLQIRPDTDGRIAAGVILEEPKGTEKEEGARERGLAFFRQAEQDDDLDAFLLGLFSLLKDLPLTGSRVMNGLPALRSLRGAIFGHPLWEAVLPASYLVKMKEKLDG